jgi:hypothetical protein
MYVLFTIHNFTYSGKLHVYLLLTTESKFHELRRVVIVAVAFIVVVIVVVVALVLVPVVAAVVTFKPRTDVNFQRTAVTLLRRYSASRELTASRHFV